MRKYKFLVFIYLISLLSYSLANSIGGNVQNLYRVPVLNIRWIDVAILIIIISFFSKLFYKQKLLKNNSFIIIICFVYVIFEFFELFRTWGVTDADSQISHYLCTLSLFIVVDLATYPIPLNKLNTFLKGYSLFGAIVLVFSNLYLLYSFLSGKFVFQDLGIRVGIEVAGSKESIYSTVLTPLVYAFGLYFLQKKIKFWEKIIYIVAILSIYIVLVLTIFRGLFLMLIIITGYFIFSKGFSKQAITKVLGIAALLIFVYFVFGNTLAKKGYDPIEKITEIAKYSTDVKDPEWDKGRSISLQYAMNAWKKNMWFGAGYDVLLNYGLPEQVATAHNGIVTSLFHRGIIGTILLLSILISLFIYAIKLWTLLNKRKKERETIFKLLILVSFLWIILFSTQEALWEKYSLSIQYMYLGIIYNIYKQKLMDKSVLKKTHSSLKTLTYNE